MRKLKRIIETTETYGLRYLFSLIAGFIIKKFKLHDALQLHKERILRDANAMFGNQFAYGIFTGMKISNEVSWGRHDALSKYLGQYESHILEKLKNLGERYDHFIDIGAADGYYAIGLLHSKLYKTATCFEISSRGREIIAKNAILNDQENNIKIYGEANKDMLEEEVNVAKSCVVLCCVVLCCVTLKAQNLNCFQKKS